MQQLNWTTKLHGTLWSSTPVKHRALILLKRKAWARKGAAWAEAQNIRPGFNTWPNYCFSLSQKHDLNQPIWNFLVKTKKAMCTIKTLAVPFPLQKGCLDLKIIPSFLLLIVFSPHPSSYKILLFWSALLCARGDACCPIHELYNKGN